MYNEETCPNLRCGQCKFFRANADRAESICKRLDHKLIKIAKPYFAAYDCGIRTQIICRDFEPKNPEYADFKDWTNFDDFWKVYTETWLRPADRLQWFTLHDDTSVRYGVPLEMFLNGTMIQDGILMAVKKCYYKKHTTSEKYPIGMELVYEDINGIKI